MDKAVLAVSLPHKGEEPPLIHNQGSGTVFLSGCNAACCFCQNYQISRLHIGNPVSENFLATEFIKLQSQGCSNINLVTPTPHLPFLVNAIYLAMEKGLNIPIVYNTNGYMNLDILKILDGIVDIYLPDMKYGEDFWAEEFSSLHNYVEINIQAISEMIRQKGTLKIDDQGAAVSGVIVRHLLLPEKTSGYTKVFRSLASLDPNITLSLMAQYQPCYKAINHPILCRPINVIEYNEALEAFHLSGLCNAYLQSAPQQSKNADPFFPDFSQSKDRIFYRHRNKLSDYQSIGEIS